MKNIKGIRFLITFYREMGVYIYDNNTEKELKNGYIGEYVESQIYSYDFRDKTATDLTNDGWTLQTGSLNFDANGIYNTAYSSNDIHISMPTTGFDFTSAKKITVVYSGIFTNRSATYNGISPNSTDVSGVCDWLDINGGYGAGGGIGNSNTSQQIPVTAGTFTQTLEVDIVNKTLKLSIPGYTDVTGTIADADLGIVSSLSYFYVHIRGLGSKTTISDLTVIVE